MDRSNTAGKTRSPQSAALHVHFLGLTAIEAAWQLQQEIADELQVDGHLGGALLLCEHPLGVTVGRDGSSADVSVDRAELERIGSYLHFPARGGGAWVHHPGQLMAYFIVPSERHGDTPARWCERLSDATNEAAAELGASWQATASRPGAAGRCGQFAFIGAAVKQGVSCYGACWNVVVPRPVLQMVNWGPGVRPTTLAAERMRPTTMSSVRECWSRHLASQAGYDRVHVWTGHPRLKRTRQPGCIVVET
jgi:lipoyl(octanoyl) transferase